MPASGERSAPWVLTRVPVEVWDRDVEGVVALLQPGVTVSGRILVDGAPPASGQQPLIQLIGIDPLALTGQSYPRVYFPGTVEIAQAKTIAAEPGARLEGLDIRLVLVDRSR